MYVTGFERGLRPIGLWSTISTLSISSCPRIASCAPILPVDLDALQPLEAAVERLVHERRLARARDAGHAHDHPERERRRRAASGCAAARSRPRSRAPRRPAAASRGRGSTSRRRGTAPVSECSGPRGPRRTCPGTMTSPPWMPEPGPMSTIWSARRIIASSCSTTRTVLPMSRSPSRILMSRSLSRGCRPTVGSSST